MKKEYMLLGLRKIEGVNISKFKEKFGENPIYLFRKELHKLVDEKNIDMRLNLENLDYIDSTGLGVIIGILKRLKIESKEVYIEKPKNNVRKIFSITGLDKIFKLEG